MRSLYQGLSVCLLVEVVLLTKFSYILIFGYEKDITELIPIILSQNIWEIPAMSEIGRVLQTRYEVTQELGVGGFGETYLANDLALPGSRLCVVKKIKALQLENSDPKHLKIVRRLFKTEAEILYKLGNEYNQIPSLYAYFEENGTFYLVQEFIDGAGLNSELNPTQNYQERQVLILLKEILEILVFVHSKGIIHRDVKPSNLIRRKMDKKLVLIDFGAVKEIGTLNSNYYGQSGLTVAIGSRGYMPSEQAMGKPHFNSDIYAVGMIGIQALTGSVPNQLHFDSEAEIAWRGQIQVSEEFTEILTSMTRYDFRSRYQTAAEVLVKINALLSEDTNLFSSSKISNNIVSAQNSQLHTKNKLLSLMKLFSLIQFYSFKAKYRLYIVVSVIVIITIVSLSNILTLKYFAKFKINPPGIDSIGFIFLFGCSAGIGVYGTFILKKLVSNTITSSSIINNNNKKNTPRPTIISRNNKNTLSSTIFSFSHNNKNTPRSTIVSRNNKNTPSSTIFYNNQNILDSYSNLNKKYEDSVEEVKLMYQKMIDIQETHINSLTSIIDNSNFQMTKLIENNDKIKESKSEREYNFNAKNNVIHLSEREGEFSIDYSNNSRNVELGGQETILQNNSTINQGDIDVTEIRNIDMNNGNYNEQKGNNNAMTNITQSHSGSGDNVGGDKNTTNNYNSQDLPQAAAEIQALLEQLEKTHPTNTTTGKMAIATEAIQQIDNDPKLAPRILSALQAGGISAFDSFLDHPAASFVIAALEDWQETKK